MALIDDVIDLSRLPGADIPGPVAGLARLSLLDWLTCGLAGVQEPVARMLRQFASAEGGTGTASVFGGGHAPARMAALVNGATSHALDYDDTHFAHVGHLSVGILPAALAVAEQRDLLVADVVVAFAVGAEAAIRIGVTLGTGHYTWGFHQTATAGAFGATVAAGRLLGLRADELRAALGLCATRASGLKSQFGTMGKPYNAGIAASNGVECASLAGLGLGSADDGLMGPQGFIETHTPDAGRSATPPPVEHGTFLFADNKYKLHACCHGTHAMIEALQDARAAHGIGLSDVASFRLRTNPRWLRVCDLKVPRTGLEVKFSYAWLAGMSLRGDATDDDRIYTDAMASDAGLAAFAARVVVEADPTLTDLQAAGALILHDGREVPVTHDLAAPLARDLLAAKLRKKAGAAIGARGEQLWGLLDSLDVLPARGLGDRIRADSA